MQYVLLLRDRPFSAIKNGTKQIEGRAPKDYDDLRYKQIKRGDIILFENEETHDMLKTKVLFLHHYKTIKEMLEHEGPEKVLSSKGTIEQGIESYYSLGNYKERVEKFGIYAIGIELIKE